MPALQLPYLSPADVLIRLRAADAPGIVLLESLGPVVPHGRFSFLSAYPVRVQKTLPSRPRGNAVFPAWLGGLKYEAARDFGFDVHPSEAGDSWWGWYPSGLMWDRETKEFCVLGEMGHIDWATVLSATDPFAPALSVGEFGADDVNYPAGVRAVQELIRAGEVYQVNLSRGVRADACGDPLAAYLHLREVNPSPFMVFADLGDEVIVSCSPERLVLWTGSTISARPIAGTRRRGDTPEEDTALETELRTTAKEVSEHTMLVDLVRHDLGRVAAPGTVHVPDLGLIERYSHVMHLVSEVSAQAQSNLAVQDVLAATFPGGTITGAPKARVMTTIRDMEPRPRGWYTGGMGIVSGARLDINILIRTAVFCRQFTATGGQQEKAGQPWMIEVRAGGGVVIDADPHREAQETVHKARALLMVLSKNQPGRPGWPPTPPTPGRKWVPSLAPRQIGLRVLLLDNEDSFTMNLAHDLLVLGAEVNVRGHGESAATLLAQQPGAVLIGPGPGTPYTSGVTLELTHACLVQGIPLLGVCLGHQALGEILGGRIERAAPVHGRPEAVRHNSQDLFTGIADGTQFGRYHSLVVRGLPSEMVTAWSAGGEVMALKVPGRPAWGVQFHPESVLSPAGRLLLSNWLRLSYMEHN